MSIEQPPGGAVISTDGKYRYELWRRWDSLLNKRRVCRFIMLNPSTADQTTDDATIRKCRSFAAQWGYTVLVVHNLFALRATDPAELRKAADPVGEATNAYLECFKDEYEITVAAWGAHGGLLGRDQIAKQLLRNAGVQVFCLGLTKNGQPRHPLYLPLKQSLMPFDLGGAA